MADPVGTEYISPAIPGKSGHRQVHEPGIHQLDNICSGELKLAVREPAVHGIQYGSFSLRSGHLIDLCPRHNLARSLKWCVDTFLDPAPPNIRAKRAVSRLLAVHQVVQPQSRYYFSPKYREEGTIILESLSPLDAPDRDQILECRHALNTRTCQAKKPHDGSGSGEQLFKAEDWRN